MGITGFLWESLRKKGSTLNTQLGQGYCAVTSLFVKKYTSVLVQQIKRDAVIPGNKKPTCKTTDQIQTAVPTSGSAL